MDNFKAIQELEKKPHGYTFFSESCTIGEPKVSINDVAGFHVTEAKSWHGDREVRVVNSSGHVVFTLMMRAAWKDDEGLE